jgi:hypothetical protein
VHGYRDNNCLPATCFAMQVHGVCQPPVIITQGMTVGTCSVTSHSQPHHPPNWSSRSLRQKNKYIMRYTLHPRTGGQLYIHDRTQLTLHQPWGHVERKEKKIGKQKRKYQHQQRKKRAEENQERSCLNVAFLFTLEQNKAMQGRRRCGGSCSLYGRNVCELFSHGCTHPIFLSLLRTACIPLHHQRYSDHGPTSVFQASW